METTRKNKDIDFKIKQLVNNSYLFFVTEVTNPRVCLRIYYHMIHVNLYVKFLLANVNVQFRCTERRNKVNRSNNLIFQFFSLIVFIINC